MLQSLVVNKKYLVPSHPLPLSISEQVTNIHIPTKSCDPPPWSRDNQNITSFMSTTFQPLIIIK